MIGLLGEEELGDTIDRLLAAVGPARSVIGWATIDLDRLGDGESLPDDHLLGAKARTLDAGRVGLEPSTEGRLAASLARFGEGPVAVYLIGGNPPERHFTLSKAADGPFGRQRLVLAGARWGPHLLLVGPDTISP